MSAAKWQVWFGELRESMEAAESSWVGQKAACWNSCWTVRGTKGLPYVQIFQECIVWNLCALHRGYSVVNKSHWILYTTRFEESRGMKENLDVERMLEQAVGVIGIEAIRSTTAYQRAKKECLYCANWKEDSAWISLGYADLHQSVRRKRLVLERFGGTDVCQGEIVRDVRCTQQRWCKEMC